MNLEKQLQSLMGKIKRLQHLSDKEAEMRLYLLHRSSILSDRVIDGNERADLITRFLQAPAKECLDAVLLEHCINTCLENESLLLNFDKLNNSNIKEAVDFDKMGMFHPKGQVWFTQFANLVKETIFVVWKRGLIEHGGAFLNDPEGFDFTSMIKL